MLLPNDFNIGKVIRSVRQSRGLSLEKFEALTNGKIKAVVMGSYERSDRKPTFDRVIEILRYLNVGSYTEFQWHVEQTHPKEQ